MKKKKLKKKIKHLEKAIENMGYRCDHWAMVARKTRDNTITYGAKVNQLNADISNYGRIINDHASRLDANKFSIDDIYKKLDVLKMRTETDYTLYGAEGQVIKFKEGPKNEKTCDTCDYPGLSGCGTQCVECPANNEKM